MIICYTTFSLIMVTHNPVGLRFIYENGCEITKKNWFIHLFFAIVLLKCGFERNFFFGISGENAKTAHFNEKKSLHAVHSLKESLSLTPPHRRGHETHRKREENRKEELYIFYYRNSIITLKIKVLTKNRFYIFYFEHLFVSLHVVELKLTISLNCILVWESFSCLYAAPCGQ